MPNRMHEFANNPLSLVQDLSTAVRTAQSEARELCATEDPDICLMGTSAGGAAVAAVSGHFEQVKKILLVAPAYPHDRDARELIEKSLGTFTGEVYIAIGDQDTVVGTDAAYVYRSLAKRASQCRVEIIPDCGHQFEGTTNGRIISKAPLWAFAGDESFPSPDGGLALY
jgi:dienelactone hydrolase